MLCIRSGYVYGGPTCLRARFVAGASPQQTKRANHEQIQILFAELKARTRDFLGQELSVIGALQRQIDGATPVRGV